jgi:hypothetical protein
MVILEAATGSARENKIGEATSLQTVFVAV